MSEKYIRGIAVGYGINDGYIWAAESAGSVFQIDPLTMQIVEEFSIRTDQDLTDNNGLVGIAIDSEGYVWTVSPEDDADCRLDPRDGTVIKVSVGDYPDSMGDMTGIQHTRVLEQL